MSHNLDLQSLCLSCVDIARDAGAAILEVYNSDYSVEHKDDKTPLTDADLASHKLIVKRLEELTPDIPVLSEESAKLPFSERSSWNTYWLVDPLDGTKEFVNRNGEFTVNIARIESGRPVWGVVHVPVQATTYVGGTQAPATRLDASGSAPITTAAAGDAPIRVVGSRSHPSPARADGLERIGPHDLMPMGSSLKFCRIAEGAADVYPRLGPTSEWDTAAAQAVVEAAGGAVLTRDGAALAYNAKADILNPHFIVVGDRSRDWSGTLA